MKTVNFEVKSRSVSVPKPISKYQELSQIASDLLQGEIKACGNAPLRLRLMGNCCSNEN